MAKQEIEVSGTKISAEDAIAFLESLNAQSICPVCGNDTWHVTISPGDGRYLAIGTVGGSPGSVNSVMSVYSTNCSRCGYVRFHSLGVLRAWLESKEENDGKS